MKKRLLDRKSLVSSVGAFSGMCNDRAFRLEMRRDSIQSLQIFPTKCMGLQSDLEMCQHIKIEPRHPVILRFYSSMRILMSSLSIQHFEIDDLRHLSSS